MFLSVLKNVMQANFQYFPMGVSVLVNALVSCAFAPTKTVFSAIYVNGLPD